MMLITKFVHRSAYYYTLQKYLVGGTSSSVCVKYPQKIQKDQNHLLKTEITFSS